MPSHLPWTASAPMDSSIASLVSINRVAGSASGGATVIVEVTGRVGSPVPTFNGVAATVTGYTGTTIITCLTPAYSGTPDVGGTAVDVACGGFTLSGAFEYHRAPTTTYASGGFETGALTPFQSASGAAASNSLAHTGSWSCLHNFTGSGDTSSCNFVHSSTDPMANANGFYIRYFGRIPTATQTALSSGQIKLLINRWNSNNNGTVELAVGPDVGNGSSQTAIALIKDGWGGNNNIGSAFTYTVDAYYEVIIWLFRDTAAHTGTCKWWIGHGGALTYMGTVTNGSLGADSGVTDLVTSVVNYSEDAVSYPITVNSDDYCLANGWVDL